MYKVGPWNCRFDAWKCMFVTVCVCVCFFTCFWRVIIKVHSLQHQRKGFLWRNSRENTGQTFSTNIYSSLKCHKPVVVWPDLSNSKNVHVLMSMWNFPSSTTTSPQRAHWNMSLWRLQQISDACDQPINHQPGLQIRFPSKTLQSFFFFLLLLFYHFLQSTKPWRWRFSWQTAWMCSHVLAEEEQRLREDEWGGREHGVKSAEWRCREKRRRGEKQETGWKHGWRKQRKWSRKRF